MTEHGNAQHALAAFVCCELCDSVSASNDEMAGSHPITLITGVFQHPTLQSSDSSIKLGMDSLAASLVLADASGALSHVFVKRRLLEELETESARTFLHDQSRT